MKLRIVLTPPAADEFEAAVEWYENEQRGTGIRLREAVFTTLRSVQNYPKAFPHIHGTVRRATVKGFPYSVMYTVEVEAMRIIAVFHASRDPSEWESRVRNQ